MSSTLLRLGLWIVVLVLAMYVLHETYEDAPFVDYFSTDLMTKALGVGAALVALGLLTRVLEKATKAATKNRCKVCRTPITQGAIYCRAHLRSILHREDDREHGTRIR